MSLKSTRARKLAVASVSALAACTAATSSAHAAQLNLTYQCAYPLLGDQPLSIAIDAAIPATTTVGVPTGVFTINSVATAKGNTYAGLGLVGAKSIQGSALASSTVSAPGFTLPVQVPITVAPYTVPNTPGDLVLNATGETPSLTFPQVGAASITVDAIKLNLSARNAAGNAIVLPPIGPDSDGNPATFDVTCTLDPTSQNTTLATIDIKGAAADAVLPSVPGAPSASAISPTAATIAWGASTDNVAVGHYEVYNGATKVATVVGTNTTARVTGLTQGTSYTLTVKARDVSGNRSASSAPVTFSTTTPGPDVSAPSKPGSPTTTATSKTVNIQWKAATDDRNVTGYDLYQNDVKIRTVTETSARVTGLTASTAYAFKVQARDAAGNASLFSDTNTITTDAPTAPINLTYTCSYPLIGSQPLSISIDAGIPSIAEVGNPTGAFKIDTVATASGSTYAGISLIGAKTIEGSAVADSSVTLPGGYTVSAAVPIDVAPYTVPPTQSDLVLSAIGETPSLVFPTAGTSTIKVERIRLNLTARKADGVPIILPPVTADSDGNPNTFDVDCVLSPNTQDTTIKTISIVSPTTSHSYGVTGQATIASLVKSSMSLTGSLNAKITKATGAFTGNLAMDQNTATLVSLTNQTVTAKVAIVASAPVAGSLRNGTLTANAKVRIKLLGVRVVGIPVGGSTCQIKQASSIALRSTGVFNPTTGGTLTGQFSISDLTGCGFLNGIVSPTTNSRGNAIALKLTPRP